VLSNQYRRDQYDHLHHTYSTDDAYRTFETFFDQNGFQDDKEKEVYDSLYPNRKRTYYEILGVPKNASIEEIRRAYRNLAMKYHPKNNTDKEAEDKFREVSEAYNHLSNMASRQAYDDYRFGSLIPTTPYNLFNSFFETRPFLAADDVDFFRPILRKTPSQLEYEFERDWGNIDSWGPKAEYAESYKSSTFHEKGPNGITGKTVTEKSSLKGGKKTTVKTEEILKPDGTKEITETVCEGGEPKVNKYLQGPGQERKALGN